MCFPLVSHNPFVVCPDSKYAHGIYLSITFALDTGKNQTKCKSTALHSDNWDAIFSPDHL